MKDYRNLTVIADISEQTELIDKIEKKFTKASSFYRIRGTSEAKYNQLETELLRIFSLKS